MATADSFTPGGYLLTMIHTTLAGIEPTTFRLLIPRATSRATKTTNQRYGCQSWQSNAFRLFWPNIKIHGSSLLRAVNIVALIIQHFLLTGYLLPGLLLSTAHKAYISFVLLSMSTVKTYLNVDLSRNSELGLRRPPYANKSSVLRTKMARQMKLAGNFRRTLAQQMRTMYVTTNTPLLTENITKLCVN